MMSPLALVLAAILYHFKLLVSTFFVVLQTNEMVAENRLLFPHTLLIVYLFPSPHTCQKQTSPCLPLGCTSLLLRGLPV